MKWLNALGMLLQFLSFWFAAPELLGANTLKRFEAGLTKLITMIPLILLLAIIAGYGLTFTILGLVKGMKAGKEGIAMADFWNYIIVLGLCTILYMIFILFYKKIKYWLNQKIAYPLTEKLIHNNQTRTTALIVGAVLFTLGFLCQFICTIL